jgi:hypothetical protein
MTGDGRRDLEKALRQSRQALPVGTALAVLGAAVLWGLHRFLGLPTWAALLLGFFVVFGAVGDAINILYVRRKLRGVEPAERSESE